MSSEPCPLRCCLFHPRFGVLEAGRKQRSLSSGGRRPENLGMVSLLGRVAGTPQVSLLGRVAGTPTSVTAREGGGNAAGEQDSENAA